MVTGTSTEPFGCIKNSHMNKKPRIDEHLTKLRDLKAKKVYASINVYSSCSPLLSEQSIMTGPTYLKR